MKSEFEAAKQQAVTWKSQLQNEQIVVKQLEFDNQRLETSEARCHGVLRDQRTSLQSAVNDKERIQSHLDQQKSLIIELESEKNATESQLLYCNSQLSNKRSQIFNLELEKKRLENSDETCNNDLRDQKASLVAMERRYNILVKSEFCKLSNRFSSI